MKKVFFLRGFLMVCALLIMSRYAHASLIPSLTLSSNTSNSSIQLTVFGADPNSSVYFMYPSTSSYLSVSVGTTNSSGYLTTQLSSSNYSITAGSPVYVTVDGQASQSQSWPNYALTSATLPLSQTSLTLNAGQSAVITASVSATLSLSNNSNPQAAGISINGNQITVNWTVVSNSRMEKKAVFGTLARHSL